MTPRLKPGGFFLKKLLPCRKIKIIARAEEAVMNIVVSLTYTAYLCGSLIALCKTASSLEP